ncbi:hypothetical protein [Streptomyces sp. 891-h]|uniref:hypothetical protein n=1 Tax=Streptomyces sp. 891-h TaxID=2720714 RepID=UPI001FA9D103|nr:hypothetical protein [Streptomyces sp. 891-h]UNZ17798.1 hypothetical protein HC362_12740 [Streptomyces sp. 891-h]
MKIELSLTELEVLSAALTRLKFDDVPPEPFFGSPHLAAAHERILRSLIEASREEGDIGRAARWDKWRGWQGREHERSLIRDYVSNLAVWNEWSDEQKVEFLVVCAAPFTLSDAELNSLREETDSSAHWKIKGQGG